MMRQTRFDAHMGPEDRDPDMESLLAEVDPAVGRRGYWATFHRSVMDAARFELARRRRAMEATVAGTVTSWARAVVPSALLTAAAAAVILLVVPAPGPTVDPELGMEEMLFIGLEDEPIPSGLEDDLSMEVSLVASEIF